MFPIPVAAEPLVQLLRGVFTRPTFERFILLMTGLIVTMGRRTVSRALVLIEPELEGHWSNYHRLFSSAKFSMQKLGAALVRQAVDLLPKDAVIELVADDTVVGKDGDRAWGKSSHRDSSRSTRSRTWLKFGHKWLWLCLLVRLPQWNRPWALPLLCAMCVSPKVAKQIGSRQKTPSQLARQLLICLMRWLPGRKFILTGDYQVITHETVAFAQRHADRVTVVGRLRGDAAVHAPPKHPQRKSRTGELPKKGRKLPPPATRVAQLPTLTQEVDWYGGAKRKVRHAGETALWFDKHGSTAPLIRWVCALGDKKQDLHDAFFFSSDPQMPGAQIISHFTRRWNIEVTFEETRGCLGLETTRHWCKQSVLRVTPILAGLFTAIVLIWNRLPAAMKKRYWSNTPCYHKQHLTFADVLAAVRRYLWEQILMRHRQKQRCLTGLPRRLHGMLLWHLAAAA